MTRTLTSPPESALAYQPEYYDTVYPSYDKQNPEYKYRHYLETAQQYQPQPSTWLDFGCANGRFLNFLKQASPTTQLYGTDVNAQAIQTAQAQYSSQQIRLGGLDALTGEWGPFEVISALDVLEHLPQLDETLSAFSRHLAPGGIVLAVMPVYDGPLGPVVHLLDKDPTHIHKKSRRFWVEKLGEQFDVLSWHGIIRYLMPGGIYLNWPTQIFKGIAPAVSVVARKR